MTEFEPRFAASWPWRAEQLRSVLRFVQKTDREWMKQVPGASTQQHTPWMPFPAAEFLTLLIEAVAEAPDGPFLEVGCGPGTRMLLAQEVTGLSVHGFDRVPEYVAAARSLGLDVEEADAATWDGYGKYAVVFFNRCFRDPYRQLELEKRVWDKMAPASVVIAANLEFPPPDDWFIVADDPDVRRWVRQKPGISPGP